MEVLTNRVPDPRVFRVLVQCKVVLTTVVQAVAENRYQKEIEAAERLTAQDGLLREVELVKVLHYTTVLPKNLPKGSLVDVRA